MAHRDKDEQDVQVARLDASHQALPDRRLPLDLSLSHKQIRQPLPQRWQAHLSAVSISVGPPPNNKPRHTCDSAPLSLVPLLEGR